MVKKGHMKNSSFVKKLGNANQNRMGAWVVRCFLSCEVLFAPHCNDVFMHDRLKASIDVFISGLTCLQLFAVMASKDKVQ